MKFVAVFLLLCALLAAAQAALKHRKFRFFREENL